MALFKPEIHVHIHMHGDNQTGDIATELRKIKQVMGENFEKLKTDVEGLNVKLDLAATATAGLKVDIDNLKEQIANLPNGATPEEIAALQTIVDGISGKADAVATALTNLDAETPAS
jgi:hypothetical protein